MICWEDNDYIVQWMTVSEKWNAGPYNANPQDHGNCYHKTKNPQQLLSIPTQGWRA